MIVRCACGRSTPNLVAPLALQDHFIHLATHVPLPRQDSGDVMLMLEALTHHDCLDGSGQ